MTISFSEIEMQYINKEFGNWSIKNECPKNVRKSLEKKFDIIREVYNYGKRNDD